MISAAHLWRVPTQPLTLYFPGLLSAVSPYHADVNLTPFFPNPEEVINVAPGSPFWPSWDVAPPLPRKHKWRNWKLVKICCQAKPNKWELAAIFIVPAIQWRLVCFLAFEKKDIKSCYFWEMFVVLKQFLVKGPNSCRRLRPELSLYFILFHHDSALKCTFQFIVSFWDGGNNKSLEQRPHLHLHFLKDYCT